MASAIIGRTNCPECGFEAAHVKQSEKCIYRYCPGCGAMYHATGATREAALRAKMRPVPGLGEPSPSPTEKPAPAPTPTQAAPTPTATPAAPAIAAPKRRGLFA